MTKVNITEIVDNLEAASDEGHFFLDKNSGKIHMISDEELEWAERKKGYPSDTPDWQKENFIIAGKILNSDSYIPLPSKFDVHEYNIMKQFCLTRTDEALKGMLLNAIRGTGAFRRFKDTLYEAGIEQDWYKFRTEAMIEIAIQWCQENGIEFIMQ